MSSVDFRFGRTYTRICIYGNRKGRPRGVVAKVLDCGFEISEFKLQFLAIGMFVTIFSEGNVITGACVLFPR